ncbi:peroxiredoxin family protein [Parasphingorhabdus sp.]|uniref:peroxiredoxin family protein n=1 Tax=Parasphingorhabdus sp. TaxID=2709688 RepID=UPI003A8D6623
MKQPALFWTSIAAVALSACSEPSATSGAEDTELMESKTTPVVAPISEAEIIDAGLAVGEKLPLEASFVDRNGSSSFAKLLADGPALIVFTRSVEWCPYCQTQLKSINAIVGDLKERGYNLYGLSYDSPDKQDRFSKNQMLQYEMLSDEPSAIIDALRLRDPQYTEGRAAGVPYASVFVIDKTGTIIAKSVSGDYRKRPSNEQILALVDAI